MGQVAEMCSVRECYNKATILRTTIDEENISDSGYIGGIAGGINRESKEIVSCYNIGKIEGTGKWSGGITSSVTRGAKVKNSYNAGNVIQRDNNYGCYVGGICANTHYDTNYGTKISEITNCYILENVEVKGNSPYAHVRRGNRIYKWICKN